MPRGLPISKSFREKSRFLRERASTTGSTVSERSGAPRSGSRASLARAPTRRRARCLASSTAPAHAAVHQCERSSPRPARRHIVTQTGRPSGEDRNAPLRWISGSPSRTSSLGRPSSASGSRLRSRGGATVRNPFDRRRGERIRNAPSAVFGASLPVGALFSSVRAAPWGECGNNLLAALVARTHRLWARQRRRQNERPSSRRSRRSAPPRRRRSPGRPAAAARSARNRTS